MGFILFLIGFGILQVDASFSTCGVQVEAVGCFKDIRSSRALPEQLINERDMASKASDKKMIEWANSTYLPSFICRCATKARSRGFLYFGIQFYGECWSGGNSSQLYHKYGKSSECRQNWQPQPNCDVQTGMGNANFVYKIVDRQCEVDYTPVGCFHDNMVKPRPLPNYAMNERDNSISNWNGNMVVWGRWNLYLPQLICRCASVARDIGHDYFSIQFYGECWTGKKDMSSYNRNGGSLKCVGKDFKSCTCTDYHCAGMQYTNFVYKLNPAANCNQDNGVKVVSHQDHVVT